MDKRKTSSISFQVVKFTLNVSADNLQIGRKYCENKSPTEIWEIQINRFTQTTRKCFLQWCLRSKTDLVIQNGLTFSSRRSLSYRIQSIDLLGKSMDWFLYDNGPRHERVKLYPWLDYDEITDCVTYFFHHWKLGDNVEKSFTSTGY